MNKSSKSLPSKITELGFLGLAFFMPMLKIFSVIFICCIAVGVIGEGDFKQRLNKLNNKRFLITAIIFYGIFVLGIFQTSNIKSGLFDLQVKASILLLPLLISLYQINFNLRWKILSSFVLGCFTSGLICIGNAIYFYFIEGDFSYFFYAKLSIFMHPSYYAMYLCLCLSILFFILFDNQRNHLIAFNKYLASSIGVFFCLLISLLSSKTGMLGYGLILLCSLGYLIYKKQTVTALVLLIILCLISFLIIQFFPQTFARFRSAQKAMNEHFNNKPSEESTVARLYVWKAAFEVIKQNPILGVGTGDAPEELKKQYKAQKIDIAIKHSLNAHNEYLQILVTLGLSGFICFMWLLWILVEYSYKRKDYLLFILVLVFCINFSTESVLETQAGVVFFAFFSSVFMFRVNGEDLKETRSIKI